MLLLKCLLKMTKNLKCLEVYDNTHFVNADSDDFLTVSDLLSTCEMVRWYDFQSTPIEVCPLDQTFVFNVEYCNVGKTKQISIYILLNQKPTVVSGILLL